MLARRLGGRRSGITKRLKIDRHSVTEDVTEDVTEYFGSGDAKIPPSMLA